MSTSALGGFEARLRWCALFIVRRERHVIDLREFSEHFRGDALNTTIEVLRSLVEQMSDSNLSVYLAAEELCDLHDAHTVHLVAGSQFKNLAPNTVVQAIGEEDQLFAFGPMVPGITYASQASEEQQQQYHIAHDETLQIEAEVRSLMREMQSHLYMLAATLSKEQGEVVIDILEKKDITLEVIARAARLVGKDLKTVIQEVIGQKPS